MGSRSAVATLLLGAVVALAGCGGGGPGAAAPSPPAEPDLVVGDGTWELVEGTVDGEPVVVPDGYRITLRVDGAQVSGTAACNSYSTSWAVDGDRVTVGDEVATTLIGCEPDVAAAEAAFVDALPRVASGTRDADGLRLTGDGVDLRFAAQPEVPTEALVGTTWVLDTLIDAEVAASVSGDRATLLLDADGGVSGSTGCRELSGTYAVEGDEVLLTSFAMDGECPDEVLAGQDSHVVTVLGDGFRATVDEDRLTVTGDDGLGLGYSASAD